MPAKRVILLGGGFAGLAAAKRLARAGAEVVLVDPRGGTHFLPVLPDLVSRDLPPSCLVYPHARAVERWGLVARAEPAVELDLSGRSVRTPSGLLEYDVLLIATGARTNFYGRDDLERVALSLDDVPDARRIRDEVGRARWRTLVVVGGGYTGVEVATHLRRRPARLGRRARVVLVERSEALCPALGPDVQRYVHREVARLGIEVRTGRTVAEATPENVQLDDGEAFDAARLIWTAGVRTGDLVQSLDREKNRQGRLYVDECLRIGERCFVAGDAAAVRGDGQDPLRMSVQLALQSGRCAGANIVRVLNGRPPKPFRLFDPGYVVPMAHFRGCGRVLGVPVQGLVPSLLHYALSVAFSFGLANRRVMARALVPELLRAR